MEDEVPEEMRPYYEELLEAIEQLPQRPDLTDPVRQLYEGVRQLVEARRQLDAGIQAIIEYLCGDGRDPDLGTGAGALL